MTCTLPESRFRSLVTVALVVGVSAAYSNTLTNDFVWDDASSVLLHNHVQDPSKLFELLREDLHAFGGGQGSFYRPLVAVSFMVDFALSQVVPGLTHVRKPGRPVGPALFHVTNVAWHIAVALLLFALLVRVNAPKPIQAVVPVVYVLHPLHTEAVAYISGRADPMATAFMLAGLWFALWEGSPGKHLAGTLLTPLCFSAALLCKETAAIFPALLLLFLFATPRWGNTRTARVSRSTRIAPFALSVLTLLVYVYLRLTALNFGSESLRRGITAGQRGVEALQAFALYIRLLFLPTGLHMERTLDGASIWLTFAGVALLLLCMVVLVVGIRRKHDRLVMGMGWFLICWFPISGVIPLNAPMAEHWMYLPMAGFLWALAEWGLPKLAQPMGQRIACAGVCAVCLVFLALTMARNRDWHDNETLFRATLEKNPRSVRVHYNLAVTYEDLMGDPARARPYYEEALRLYAERRRQAGQPEDAEVLSKPEIEAHLSLGNIYLQDGHYQHARDHFAAVLAVPPDPEQDVLRATAAFGMGRSLLAVGDPHGAARYFDQALIGRPDLQKAIENLMPQRAPASTL